MGMASLLVAIAAILIAAIGVVYAKRSADSARQSAAAAEESLSIERRRRHEERRPELSGKVNSPDGGHSYQLVITLDADSCSLTALEVTIRPDQGVSFQRNFSGVIPIVGSAPVLLRAFAYDRTNKPAGLQPGEAIFWWVEVAQEHGDRIQVDAPCHAAGKDEGEDQWTIVVEAPIEPSLLDTIW
jgi:hypothetical protein